MNFLYRVVFMHSLFTLWSSLNKNNKKLTKSSLPLTAKSKMRQATEVMGEKILM